MASYKYKIINGVVWGRLPCGEVHKYKSVKAYTDAYHAEEDEIADAMARLEEERIQEWPEDYSFLPERWLEYA